ncbi:MAG TPA: alpha/beta hydrolase [Burkholderiales bacterium]|nr:alpha/beta hydrolase [Burkholderiales bacterium]
MHPSTLHQLLIPGAAGVIDTLLNDPGETRRGIALIAHPHPLMGGTNENKVVQTLAKTFFALGYAALRPNFRGVGQSAGVHDKGIGETEDLLTVIRYAQEKFGELPVTLAGFSFGSYVQTRVVKQISAERLVLVAPAVSRFETGEVPAETLVIHGEVDDVVPLTSVFDWVRPQNLPVVVVPGSGHFFHGRLHILNRLVSRYCAG